MAANNGDQVCAGAVSMRGSKVLFHFVSFLVGCLTCLISNPHKVNNSCYLISLAFCAVIPSVAWMANAFVPNEFFLFANNDQWFPA
jgi:hypothetical protein